MKKKISKMKRQPTEWEKIKIKKTIQLNKKKKKKH